MFECLTYLESFCSNRSSLQTILEEMPLPSERHILHQKSSGCKLPCSYFEYEAMQVTLKDLSFKLKIFKTLTFRKIGDTSLAQEFAPHMDRACLLTLELSTGDVETDFEVPAYSVGGFIGNVAGNLGMIFGMSLYAIPFATITSYDRYNTYYLECNEIPKPVNLMIQIKPVLLNGTGRKKCPSCFCCLRHSHGH